jgi:hypothetical protein
VTDLKPDAMMLRFAIQNLACAPQAQRRYVQLGFMTKAVANLDRIAADLEPLITQGLIDDEQAELACQVHAELKARLAEDPRFLREDVSGPREFLYSDELEGDDWRRLRQLARRAYTAIVGESSPFIAIMAK